MKKEYNVLVDAIEEFQSLEVVYHVAIDNGFNDDTDFVKIILDNMRKSQKYISEELDELFDDYNRKNQDMEYNGEYIDSLVFNDTIQQYLELPLEWVERLINEIGDEYLFIDDNYNLRIYEI
jgi:hypothetical protein